MQLAASMIECIKLEMQSFKPSTSVSVETNTDPPGAIETEIAPTVDIAAVKAVASCGQDIVVCEPSKQAAADKVESDIANAPKSPFGVPVSYIVFVPARLSLEDYTAAAANTGVQLQKYRFDSAWSLVQVQNRESALKLQQYRLARKHIVKISEIQQHMLKSKTIKKIGNASDSDEDADTSCNKRCVGELNLFGGHVLVARRSRDDNEDVDKAPAADKPARNTKTKSVPKIAETADRDEETYEQDCDEGWMPEPQTHWHEHEHHVYHSQSDSEPWPQSSGWQEGFDNAVDDWYEDGWQGGDAMMLGSFS